MNRHIRNIAAKLTVIMMLVTLMPAGAFAAQDDGRDTATVTFRIVGGTWSDGTTAEKTAQVILRDGKGTLPTSAIPKDMICDAEWAFPRWTPGNIQEKGAITGDTTFTCIFKTFGDVKVTFDVVNGTWADGTTETIVGYPTMIGGEGTLRPSDIPAGMKPAEGYEGGSWNVEPDTSEGAVRGDLAYVYTFTPMTEADITFRVENGTWEDGSSSDIEKTVPMTDGRGTLPDAYIPLGMTPSEGYEGGSWDVVPDTAEGAVRGHRTYTYTFTEIHVPAEEADITFRVENGTWKDGTSEDIAVHKTLTEGRGTLDPSEIPEGMTPAAGYEGGSWNVVPDTAEGAVTGDVTYIYTFTEKAPVTAKVTFRIVNGGWYDTDFSDDLVEEVVLTDGKGTLDPSMVPEVMVPAKGHGMGSWDVEPDTSEGAVTEDVVYTYTYLPCAKISFKVENGTWADGTDGTISEEILLEEGKATLRPSKIPVGMLPDEGYTEGIWNEVPDTSPGAVTKNMTYRYVFFEDTDPVIIDEENFPDRAFREYLEELEKGEPYDGDGSFSPHEILMTKELKCRDMGIRDLTGIDRFICLESLDCSDNSLTELDLTGNRKLVSLACRDNLIGKLQLPDSGTMRTIWSAGNRLLSFDSGSYPYLELIELNGNRLAAMDITKNSGLYVLLIKDCFRVVPDGMPVDRLDGFDEKNVLAVSGGSLDKGRVDFDEGSSTLKYIYDAVPGGSGRFDVEFTLFRELGVTFRVENGTWSDGTSADRKGVLTQEGQKATLDAGSIPEGMVPSEGYEGGSWNVEPDASENGIETDTVYTYTFTEKAVPEGDTGDDERPLTDDEKNTAAGAEEDGDSPETGDGDYAGLMMMMAAAAAGAFFLSRRRGV